MSLHEGEKYRCVECNAQIAVVRSSDTRSSDFELPRATTAAANAYSQDPANEQFSLYCCGRAMVRFCMTAAS
jgi:hypothetical protein